MRTAPFLALAALAGCVRITDEEYDQRIDRDGDGYVSTQFGGDDCDDRSASVHPGAAEACDGEQPWKGNTNVPMLYVGNPYEIYTVHWLTCSAKVFECVFLST